MMFDPGTKEVKGINASFSFHGPKAYGLMNDLLQWLSTFEDDDNRIGSARSDYTYHPAKETVVKGSEQKQEPQSDKQRENKIKDEVKK